MAYRGVVRHRKGSPRFDSIMRKLHTKNEVPNSIDLKDIKYYAF